MPSPFSICETGVRASVAPVTVMPQADASSAGHSFPLSVLANAQTSPMGQGEVTVMWTNGALYKSTALNVVV